MRVIRRSRRGITLLEVLVAALLLMFGLMATLDVIAGSARASYQTDDRALALIAARSKLEEILKEPVLQVGTDEGKGVDTTTEYDWTANIEQSSNAALYLITVRAENRNHPDLFVTLSALRRPDLEPADETTGGTTTGTDATTGADTGGGQL